MPPKSDFSLNVHELTQIEGAMTDKRPKVQRRARAIWMLSQGCSIREITQAVNVRSRTTIYDYWQRFKADGLDGLADRPRPGRPLKADADYCVRLETALTQQPYQGWTADMLRDHMQQETGITISDYRFRVLLHRLGYRYGRVRSTPDIPIKRPQTAAEWRAWLEALPPMTRDVFSWQKVE